MQHLQKYKLLHFHNNSTTDTTIINDYYLIHYLPPQHNKRESNMKHLHHTIPAVLISTLVLLPLSASAEWGVGFNLETTQSMYKKEKGDRNTTTGTVHIEHQGERFNIHKGIVSYALVNADKYAVDVLATSKHNGYEAKDKKVFKGMKNRKASLDVGMRLRANTTYLPISLSVTKDIHKNKGTEIGLSLGGIQNGQSEWTGKRSISVAPVFGADWQSKKVVDYYYGVKNSEATANRKAYKGKSALTPFVGLEAEARLSKNFSLIGSAKYKRLPGAITDSSITQNNRSDYKLNLGFNYWF